MERTIIIVVPIVMALLVSAYVATTAVASDAEFLLAQSSLHLDYKADKTGWPTVVFDQLTSEFKVSEARIFNLRQQGLSYGEISTVLSLAEQMPGGINDRNIQKVLALHDDGGYKIGWGSVAKALHVNVDNAIHHTEAMNESSWSGHAAVDRPELDAKPNRRVWGDTKMTGQLQSEAPRLEEGMKPGN
jgi:hypothetical protein